MLAACEGPVGQLIVPAGGDSGGPLLDLGEPRFDLRRVSAGHMREAMIAHEDTPAVGGARLVIGSPWPPERDAPLGPRER